MATHTAFIWHSRSVRPRHGDVRPGRLPEQNLNHNYLPQPHCPRQPLCVLKSTGTFSIRFFFSPIPTRHARTTVCRQGKQGYAAPGTHAVHSPIACMPVSPTTWAVMRGYRGRLLDTINWRYMVNLSKKHLFGARTLGTVFSADTCVPCQLTTSPEGPQLLHQHLGVISKVSEGTAPDQFPRAHCTAHSSPHSPRTEPNGHCHCNCPHREAFRPSPATSWRGRWLCSARSG